jgi:hypothetical protein
LTHQCQNDADHKEQTLPEMLKTAKELVQLIIITIIIIIS